LSFIDVISSCCAAVEPELVHREAVGDEGADEQRQDDLEDGQDRRVEEPAEVAPGVREQVDPVVEARGREVDAQVEAVAHDHVAVLEGGDEDRPERDHGQHDDRDEQQGQGEAGEATAAAHLRDFVGHQ
jgi:hypothetical protein